MCWSVKAVENPTGIQNDICSLSPQRVFNLETLTGADEAAVSVVLSEKTSGTINRALSESLWRKYKEKNFSLYIDDIGELDKLC